LPPPSFGETACMLPVPKVPICSDGSLNELATPRLKYRGAMSGSCVGGGTADETHALENSRQLALLGAMHAPGYVQPQNVTPSRECSAAEAKRAVRTLVYQSPTSTIRDSDSSALEGVDDALSLPRSLALSFGQPERCHAAVAAVPSAALAGTTDLFACAATARHGQRRGNGSAKRKYSPSWTSDEIIICINVIQAWVAENPQPHGAGLGFARTAWNRM
jgi:hypothetical protein